VQRPLNIEQLVMVKDRHRLNRLKKGKDANEKQYQALFEQSHLKVLERIERIPNIKLNQDLPVTQYADKLIDAIQERLDHVETMRYLGQCTLPSSIEIELETNPFLRTENVEEFKRLRDLKDQF
jgi:hypothetical protein